MVEQTTGKTVLVNLRHPMRRQRPLLHHRGFIFKTACFSTNQKMEVEKEIKLGLLASFMEVLRWTAVKSFLPNVHSVK